MKGILLVTLCLALLTTAAYGQQQDGPLTNVSVVKLVKAGFKEKTIIAIIGSRLVRFDLSTDGLVELKRNNVSEHVILAMLQQDEWKYAAPASLIFYGISLVNASKYTLTDIRYLGVMEIILGLINTQFIDYGLYFWATGFGLLHIIYGAMMWWKYERV